MMSDSHSKAIWLKIQAAIDCWEGILSATSGVIVVALLRRLWLIAWDMWEQRNQVLHKQQNKATTLTIIEIDNTIKSL
jgi:hypothetical protein